MDVPSTSKTDCHEGYVRFTESRATACRWLQETMGVQSMTEMAICFAVVICIACGTHYAQRQGRHELHELVFLAMRSVKRLTQETILLTVRDIGRSLGLLGRILRAFSIPLDTGSFSQTTPTLGPQMGHSLASYGIDVPRISTAQEFSPVETWANESREISELSSSRALLGNTVGDTSICDVWRSSMDYTLTLKTDKLGANLSHLQRHVGLLVNDASSPLDGSTENDFDEIQRYDHRGGRLTGVIPSLFTCIDFVMLLSWFMRWKRSSSSGAAPRRKSHGLPVCMIMSAYRTKCRGFSCQQRGCLSDVAQGCPLDALALRSHRSIFHCEQQQQ